MPLTPTQRETIAFALRFLRSNIEDVRADEPENEAGESLQPSGLPFNPPSDNEIDDAQLAIERME